MQLTVSEDGWVTPPVHVPTTCQDLVCCWVIGQSVGDNVEVQLDSEHGGTYVQDCEVTGLPPAQLAGEDVKTDLV